MASQDKSAWPRSADTDPLNSLMLITTNEMRAAEIWREMLPAGRAGRAEAEPRAKARQLWIDTYGYCSTIRDVLKCYQSARRACCFVSKRCSQRTVTEFGIKMHK